MALVQPAAKKDDDREDDCELHFHGLRVMQQRRRACIVGNLITSAAALDVELDLVRQTGGLLLWVEICGSILFRRQGFVFTSRGCCRPCPWRECSARALFCLQQLGLQVGVMVEAANSPHYDVRY